MRFYPLPGLIHFCRRFLGGSSFVGGGEMRNSSATRVNVSGEFCNYTKRN
jgi:hypothetical protein